MRLLLLTLLLSALPAFARTAADFFVSAPTAQIGIVPAHQRQEMVVNYTAGSETPSRNIFGTPGRLTVNRDNLLTCESSDRSTISVAVLPAGRDTTIALIETVATPIPDSRMTFYTTDWTPLKHQPQELEAMDFVAKGDRKKAKDLEMPEFIFYTITYNPDDSSFLLANTTAKFFTKNDRPAGLPLMQPAVNMRWNGKKLTATNGKH